MSAVSSVSPGKLSEEIKAYEMAHLTGQDKVLDCSLGILRASRVLYREPHSEIAKSLESVAERLSNLGRYNEALSFFKQTAEMRQELSGMPNVDLARALTNVGACLGYLGRHKEAKSYDLKALGMKREVFSPSHPNLACSFNNMGVTLGSLAAIPAEQFFRVSKIFLS